MKELESGATLRGENLTFRTKYGEGVVVKVGKKRNLIYERHLALINVNWSY